MIDSLKCSECNYESNLETFDIIGACTTNVFCPQCNSEIDSDTGKLAARCHRCDACEEIELDADEGQQLGLF